MERVLEASILGLWILAGGWNIYTYHYCQFFIVGHDLCTILDNPILFTSPVYSKVIGVLKSSFLHRVITRFIISDGLKPEYF